MNLDFDQDNDNQKEAIKKSSTNILRKLKSNYIRKSAGNMQLCIII